MELADKRETLASHAKAWAQPAVRAVEKAFWRRESEDLGADSEKKPLPFHS